MPLCSLPVFCILMTFYAGSHQTALKTASMNAFGDLVRTCFPCLWFSFDSDQLLCKHRGCVLEQLTIEQITQLIFF